MPKMDNSALKAMLASQYAGAMAASNASKLSGERADAMAYYNGDVSKDMPAAAGRSSAVSMDVSDTVEGILPQLMEVFCGTDEVVKFEPVGPEDEKAAEQETDYINHVFMNQNPGFLVLYSFIKDALLSKVGVVKVWWEKTEKEEKETYLDKTDDEYALIVADPDVEVIEHSVHDAEPGPEAGSVGGALPGADAGGSPSLAGLGEAPKLHDVTVVTKKTTAQAYVLGVPPEEFGIEAGARNIRDCNYCFHKIVNRTEAQLIEMGYDAAQVKALPSYRAWNNTEEVARDTADESANSRGDETNAAARLVEITEHYVRMNYEGNGKSCLYRVTTGGKNGEILRRDGSPDVIEFDAIPFAAMTPVIVTHRFYGKSLADLVMDIQRIKTALWRGALDSLYISLNPRVEVSESHASENTLDDLLVSRPNQIVRTKAPGGLTYQTSPDVTPSVYPALEYMDQRLETRTGASKRGQGIEPDALLNQSATAAKIVENASQARVRLIARIFAETGIKDLFWLLHGTIKKHGEQAAVVRLKNQWVTVDPREWKTRDDLTVHVGLGTGGRQQEIAEITMIAAMQKDLLLNGKTNLVNDKNLYATLSSLVKATGRPNVDAYFSDPSAVGPDGKLVNPPPPPQPDPKIMELQVKSQLEERALNLKAEIEKIQAQADIATQDRKTEAEIALADRKFALERELAVIEHQAKMAESQQTMAMKSQAHEQSMAMAEKKQQSEGAKASIEVKHGAEEITGPLSQVISQLGEHVANSHAAQMQALMAAVESNKPKARRIKGPSGRVYTIEDVH